MTEFDNQGDQIVTDAKPKTTADMNQQERAYTRVLADVIKILRGRYVTVSGVAAEMGCTYEGASRRIQSLVKLGCELDSEVSKHGVAGAPPRAYKLVPNKASRRILDAARRMAESATAER